MNLTRREVGSLTMYDLTWMTTQKGDTIEDSSGSVGDGCKRLFGKNASNIIFIEKITNKWLFFEKKSAKIYLFDEIFFLGI